MAVEKNSTCHYKSYIIKNKRQMTHTKTKKKKMENEAQNKTWGIVCEKNSITKSR